MKAYQWLEKLRFRFRCCLLGLEPIASEPWLRSRRQVEASDLMVESTWVPFRRDVREVGLT